RTTLDQAFFASERGLDELGGIGELGLDAYIDTQVRLMASELGDSSLAPATSSALIALTRAGLKRSRELLLQHAAEKRRGLVSNFHSNLPKILAETGLDACFDSLSVSALVGAKKPDAAIFHHALGRLGVEPSDSLMIGDSLASDIMPAKSLG